MNKLNPGDTVRFTYHEKAFSDERGILLEATGDCFWVKLVSGESFDDVDPTIGGDSRKEGAEWLFAKIYLKKVCGQWDD